MAKQNSVYVHDKLEILQVCRPRSGSWLCHLSVLGKPVKPELHFSINKMGFFFFFVYMAALRVEANGYMGRSCSRPPINALLLGGK